jgi:hypothetical protein
MNKQLFPIKNFEDRYVSTIDGKVYCKKKTIKNDDVVIYNGKTYYRRSTEIHHLGYEMIKLYDGKRKHSVFIHRIIADINIPNPENKPCVNHINGNKRDNSISNLEWCTYKENNDHAQRTGLNPRSNQALGQVKFKNSKEEKEIKWMHEKGFNYTELAIIYNVSRNVTTRICKGLSTKYYTPTV